MDISYLQGDQHPLISKYIHSSDDGDSGGFSTEGKKNQCQIFSFNNQVCVHFENQEFQNRVNKP